MSKTLRTLAAAAVMAVGLPQMASAALTTLNFEGIADGTDLTGALNPYNDAAHGFTTFSGSAAALDSLDAKGNSTISLWSPCPPQNCAGAQASLTITVGQLFHGDGGAVNGLLLDVGNSDALQYKILDANGKLLKDGDFDPPTGFDFRPNPVFIAFTGAAKSIVFTGAAAGFQIDNLSFSLDAVTTNPVPEPTTAALVALALAGVGVLRRKA